MNQRSHTLISNAHGLLARGDFEAAIDVLKPIVESRNGCREARMEALALSATACNRLAWYQEETDLRRRRLGMIRESGTSEARERAQLATAQVALGNFAAAEETIAPVTPQWGCQEWTEALRVHALVAMRRDRDYAKAAQLTQEASALLEHGGGAFDRGRLRVLSGIVLRMASRVEEARTALLEGQRLLGDLIDQNPPALQEYAKAEFFIGDLHQMRGDMQGALGHYEHARSLLGKRASAHFVKRYYLRLAQINYSLGDYVQAGKLYVHPELLAAVEKIGNLEGYFWCYLGAAAAALASQRIDEAEQCLAEAMKCIDAKPSRFIAGHVRLAHADMALARNELDAADAGYREAESLFRQVGATGHLQGISDCLACRGEIEIRRKNVPGLLAVVKECAALATTSGHLDLQVKALLLKSVALAEGAEDREELFRDVLAHLDTISSPVTMFKVVSNIYHYARKFADYQLDLELEKRIQDLKNVLASETYFSLYRECVDRRYAERIMDLLTKRKPPPPNNS